MKHSIDKDYENESSSSKQKLLILIPLAAIALILVFCIIKIIVWNNGTRYHYIEPDDLSVIDSEPMDYYTGMDRSLLEGRDDGETHILFLGDDIFTFGDAADSIPNQVAAQTGATVYNCAFPQSTLASRYSVFNEDYCTDAFSFVRIAYCIKSDNYDLINAYKANADIYDPSFEETIAALMAIDFNKIDMIFLDYGTYDYLNGHMTTDVNDEKAADALTGSLYSGICAIWETYPHIRFIVMSPTFCYYDEGDGTLTPGDIRRVGSTNANLGGYIVALRAMSESIGVSFLDNYFGIPLHAETAQEYLLDAVHVNDKIRALISDKVIDFIQNKQYTY